MQQGVISRYIDRPGSGDNRDPRLNSSAAAIRGLTYIYTKGIRVFSVVFSSWSAYFSLSVRASSSASLK
jgi:hypothetical protein